MAGIKDEIAKNILYYRKKNCLTQKDLASALGVKHTAVSSWENGVNSVDVEILFNICRVLNVSINDMYGIYGAQKMPSDLRLQRITDNYHKLNGAGRDSLAEYSDLLAGSPTYTDIEKNGTDGS